MAGLLGLQPHCRARTITFQALPHGRFIGVTHTSRKALPASLRMLIDPLHGFPETCMAEPFSDTLDPARFISRRRFVYRQRQVIPLQVDVRMGIDPGAQGRCVCLAKRTFKIRVYDNGKPGCA
ncbi:hypothetical protein IB69_016315 [Xanthomonas citri]|nr:hypothetical protein RM64_17435 [Xanthomonas phaseoli pv. phaseoli]KHS38036.1 hypothetical protein RN19_09275 [Xanthomonas phaseoli pv. phaseoli]OQP73164.1 hypothetical protein IB69_016315 [Xanthomonas citri]